MPRILAIDIGEKRTGLAVSSADARHASALQVIETKAALGSNKILSDIIKDFEIAKIIVGLPLLADGSEGQQARRTRSLAARLLAADVDCSQRSHHISFTDNSDTRTIPIIFFDERTSSKSAKDAGHSAGLSEKDMRGKLDAHAAAAFLQVYLDTIDS